MIFLMKACMYIYSLARPFGFCFRIYLSQGYVNFFYKSVVILEFKVDTDRKFFILG